jgi:7-cyano-7-deazaguanine synthase
MHSPHILFSGGLDSLVALAVATITSPTPATLIFCDAGFRCSPQERLATKRIAKHYGAKVVEIGLSIQAMRDHIMTDTGTLIYYDNDPKAIRNSKKAFIIPYRNFFLVSLALNTCAVNGADSLWVGFDYEEEGGSSKDKSPAFVDAFQHLIKFGAESGEGVELITPLQFKSKREIIEMGVKLNVPFELAWTCYNDLSKPCGVCNSCVDRLKGFVEAGLTDPQEYASERSLRIAFGVRDYKLVRRRCGISYEYGKSVGTL